MTLWKKDLRAPSKSATPSTLKILWEQEQRQRNSPLVHWADWEGLQNSPTGSGVDLGLGAGVE